MDNSSFWVWLVVIGVAALAVWNTSQKTKRAINRAMPKQRGNSQMRNRAAAAPAEAVTPTGAEFAWPALNQFEFEIVGESHYQSVLDALCGGWKNPAVDGIGTACLVPEDTNPYDDKAVRVDMGAHTVGYLSRDDARKFRRRLAGKKLTGAITVCGAAITGGHTNRMGEKMHYGVTLDIKPFE
jgi:hypothetical protein